LPVSPEVKARILRELADLSWQTQLLEGQDAVIYVGLPSSLGVVEKTDVLVPVPSGYPQAMLDYAFLPADSPLKGLVPGAVQGNLQFGDRAWTQISYHPHNGGGGPMWDPRIHGFHTYVDEVLTWLARH
jgi:hypothetical protein